MREHLPRQAADMLDRLEATFGWLLAPTHRATAALVAGLVTLAVTLFRIYLIKRTLWRRREYAILPTTRYINSLKNPKSSAELPVLFGRTLSQVRLRRLIWWTRPAGAIRIRMDSVSCSGTVYSMGGPPWARTVLETPGYAYLVVTPFETLDPRTLTPKGMRFLPAGQAPGRTGG